MDFPILPCILTPCILAGRPDQNLPQMPGGRDLQAVGLMLIHGQPDLKPHATSPAIGAGVSPAKVV